MGAFVRAPFLCRAVIVQKLGPFSTPLLAVSPPGFSPLVSKRSVLDRFSPLFHHFWPQGTGHSPIEKTAQSSPIDIDCALCPVPERDGQKW